MASISIIGAGGWGTALAKLLSENGHRVKLWARRTALTEKLTATGVNEEYLPAVTLPKQLSFTSDLELAAAGAEVLLIAAPSHALRMLLPKLPRLARDTIIVSAVKGIEPESHLRMSQVIAESLGDQRPIVALSGPNIAMEIARGIPSATVVACEDLERAKIVQSLLMNPYFRAYSHCDIVGVELGGALKNIIALAAGIADGAGFGDNTKAALMTRGLVEMTRLATRLGAEAATFAGLSGMGDLIVTCMSKNSRNRYVGEQIGQGKHLQDVLDSMKMVAEGVRTTRAAYSLAQKFAVDMPITAEVHRVLFENQPPHEAVNNLMMRDAKMEKFG